MIVRGALDLQNEMVPGIGKGVARYASRVPCLTGIIPDVPLIATRYPAFMPPNVGIAINKLVDIELQRLGGAKIIGVKIDIVGEIVDVGDNRVVKSGPLLTNEYTCYSPLS